MNPRRGEKVVSPGFEPRSAGPEPTMMDRYTKRLADGPKASHSSIKRCFNQPRNDAITSSSWAALGLRTSSPISTIGVSCSSKSSSNYGFSPSKYNNPITCIFSASALCRADNAATASETSCSSEIVSKRIVEPSCKVMSR